ncbi:MAG: 1-acyl-sn-glycerol-3-phosphate acyltransferase [Lentisphaeria bacterium]|nr:1-acyl-sn-glycerol-3-phosphate acyltransferase [Lentisphaeria bacterium]
MFTLLVSISVAISIALYSAVALIPYLCILLLPKQLREHLMRSFIVLNLGRTVIHLGLRPFIPIQYRDEAGTHTPPGIYVCNHRAGTDAFLMALFGVEAIQIVNGWPMKLPVVGFNARMAGYLDSTKTALEDYPAIFKSLIEKNVSIIAFPEGTRSGSRNMNIFHSGIFRLAMELDIPVYPCCIAGNEQFPDRSFHFHPAKGIIVKRLPPILPETFHNYPSAYVFKKKVHDMIQQENQRLDAELDSR